MRRTLFLAAAILSLLAAIWPGSVRAAASSKPDMRAAVKALREAASDSEKDRIVAEVSRGRPETVDDLDAVLDVMKHLENDSDVREKADRNRRRAARLHAVLGSASGHGLKGRIARALAEEAASIPQDYFGPVGQADPVKAAKDEIRARRVAGLVDAAGDGGNEDALPTLRMLEGKGGLPEQWARRAIARIGKAEDLERLISRIKAEPKARIDLTGFGPQLIDRIIRDVEDPGLPEDQRRRLLAHLDQATGPAALKRYEALLDHKNPMIAQIAARSVALSAKPTDTGTMARMLADAKAETRFAALVMLDEKMWSKSYVAEVIKLLKSDQDEGIRELAAHVLGKHKVLEAKADLEAAQQDKSARVRDAARGALGQLSGDYDRRVQDYVDKVKQGKKKE